ncbi:MAG: galactokinase, partial [Candidatus Rokubacteria bacterium]|nr:galactokinase [Candidatus Rokubacteria bacterium]
MTGFDALFGGVPAVTAAAPGRVNLIGEHTDYNDGFVLPIALRRRTQVELAPRAGRRVRVWSEAAGGAGVVAYELGEEHRRHDWVDYIQGVTDALARDGQAIGGFDARVESSVPVGRGLASSAALEIALLRALREAFGLGLDELAMARLGRAAENDFVGAPVGIMDQMAAALGDAGHALFIDTRTLAWERLPQPATVELVVVDSGISHRHASGEYRVRRDECGRAAARLGVAALRDLAP